jgi:ribosomal-protein-alanine N-acetyltransferase
MTPQALAALHAVAFAPDRGWSATEFADLCAAPDVRLFTVEHGFALVRVVAEEAELLTLAVDPAHRRRGFADRLMRAWMGGCPALTAFLEVAEDNTAAQALYAKHGFAPVGRRRAYYTRPGARPVDALLMQSALTPRRPDENPS